jgi:hypothetical protein
MSKKIFKYLAMAELPDKKFDVTSRLEKLILSELRNII